MRQWGNGYRATGPHPSDVGSNPTCRTNGIFNPGNGFEA